jgi:cytoskeletal protein CcmA (bactofilin family)
MSEPLSTERTFFSKGTRIEGTLELEGEVKLEGQIKGKITGTGVVTVGEHANLQADLTAPTIIIHGAVQGQVHATDRLELHRTAKVKGMLQATRIRIDDGAIFEGECRMGAPATVKAEPPRVEPARVEPPKPEEKRPSSITLAATPPAKPILQS